MKILQVPDSPWSIGRLCDGIRKFNPQIDWEVIYVPPRDIHDNLEKIEKAAANCDLIDFQYWNSARMLIDALPALQDKPKILTYHTMPNKKLDSWGDMNALVVKTDAYFSTLDELYPGKVYKIENCPDFEEFQWNDNYPPNKPAVGYAGRITSWKGLKEIARACYELGYPLHMMGVHDKIDYWNSIPKEYKDIMVWDWWECPDDSRQDFYNSLTIYVGNSEPDHEAGTLPFLEAMVCGVPVVTTTSGMAADIVEDGKDVLLVEYGNYEDLKAKIKRAMEDEALRLELRKNAWSKVRQFTYERMARQYEKLYNEVLYPYQAPVSVIIPATFDRADLVKQIIISLENQSYKNIEAIVVWDEETVDTFAPVANSTKISVKNLFTRRSGYNLAMARNLGIIEAIGDVVIFCDSRICPEPWAIEKFAEAVLTRSELERIWFFGDKGFNKKDFVENFSAIRRSHIVRMGMFNERITCYGGMSQEIRSRMSFGQFKFQYLPEVKAHELKSSKLNSTRRSDIVKMKNLMYKLGVN